MARVLGQSPSGELPAQRDQGLGTWIQQRTDRPLKHACGRDGLLEGGLDFHYPSRLLAHGPGNDSAGSHSRARRQALGGSEGLSFMR